MAVDLATITTMQEAERQGWAIDRTRGKGRNRRAERIIMTETTTVTRIVWHLNTPDLFERWEEDDIANVDQGASGNRYVDQVNAALWAEYPDAEIVCQIDRNATGYCPEPTVECGEDEAPEVEVDYVQDTIGRIYADQEWIVKLAPIKTTA